MSQEDMGSFRFGTLSPAEGEGPPDDDNGLVELQLRKINRRFWWLLIVTILLVGGLFSAGYLDLKKRFSVQQTSGVREIETISAVLEDRLNEHQTRLDALDASLIQETDALDKKTVVWQKDLAALRQTVEQLDLTGTVQKEQKALLQQVGKDIAPLEQKIAALQTDLAGIEKKIAAQVAPLSEALAKNAEQITRLRNRIDPITGEILSKDALDLELLMLRKTQRQSLVDEISGLQRQIGLLIERVQRLESRPAAVVPPPASGTSPGGIQEQPLP